MKKLLALILAVLTLTAALCGCGDTAAPGTADNDAPVSTPDAGETGDTGNSGNAVVTTSLPGTFEIAAADETKCAEIKGYVDEMVNTVRAAQ